MIKVSFVRRRSDEPMHADAAVKGLRPGEAIDWRALPPASAFVMMLPRARRAAGGAATLRDCVTG
jgi:hypothetical protein